MFRNKKTIVFVLGLVLALIVSVANADYTFGEPAVVTTNRVSSSSVSTDGLSLYVDAPDGPGSWGIWANTRNTTHDGWPDDTAIYSTPPNSSYSDGNPDISADGLTLFFDSDRPGGEGDRDIYVLTRATTDDLWSEPVNLGPPINSAYFDAQSSVSPDGLSLFFCSKRPGGEGGRDIYVSTRATTDHLWSEPVNLGPIVNSSSDDSGPDISSDGLTLFFDSYRPGGKGQNDVWVTTRATTDDPWGVPKNLGPVVNNSSYNYAPCISADGSTLYWWSTVGRLRRVSINPVVDLNGDGIVDVLDAFELLEHWGTDNSLYDIAPSPFGDGMVDARDLIVLAEHMLVEDIHIDEHDNDSQVELDQGQVLVITLESNPTTGYRWEQVETQDSILQPKGEIEYTASESGVVGAGSSQIFRFEATSSGQMTLQMIYHKPWENVEPLKTFSIQVVVP
jgi:predicted secreted protein